MSARQRRNSSMGEVKDPQEETEEREAKRRSFKVQKSEKVIVRGEEVNSDALYPTICPVSTDSSTPDFPSVIIEFNTNVEEDDLASITEEQAKLIRVSKMLYNKPKMELIDQADAENSSMITDRFVSPNSVDTGAYDNALNVLQRFKKDTYKADSSDDEKKIIYVTKLSFSNSSDSMYSNNIFESDNTDDSINEDNVIVENMKETSDVTYVPRSKSILKKENDNKNELFHNFNFEKFSQRRTENDETSSIVEENFPMHLDNDKLNEEKTVEYCKKEMEKINLENNTKNEPKVKFNKEIDNQDNDISLKNEIEKYDNEGSLKKEIDNNDNEISLKDEVKKYEHIDISSDKFMEKIITKNIKNQNIKDQNIQIKTVLLDKISHKNIDIQKKDLKKSQTFEESKEKLINKVMSNSLLKSHSYIKVDTSFRDYKGKRCEVYENFWKDIKSNERENHYVSVKKENIKKIKSPYEEFSKNNIKSGVLKPYRNLLAILSHEVKPSSTYSVPWEKLVIDGDITVFQTNTIVNLNDIVDAIACTIILRDLGLLMVSEGILLNNAIEIVRLKSQMLKISINKKFPILKGFKNIEKNTNQNVFKKLNKISNTRISYTKKSGHEFNIFNIVLSINGLLKCSSTFYNYKTSNKQKSNMKQIARKYHSRGCYDDKIKNNLNSLKNCIQVHSLIKL